MSQVTNDFTTGVVIVQEQYDLCGCGTQSDVYASPTFSTIGQEYITSMINLTNIQDFADFHYEADGILETRYLQTYYRVSYNNIDFTDWLDLPEYITNFPPFDPMMPMFIDIKFVRGGDKTDGVITLNGFKLIGNLLQNIAQDSITVAANDEAIIYPPFIFKVFKIYDIEIISPSDLTGVSMSYRYSQDNSRSWSAWTPLSKENITTERINPVRFFQIQYLVQNNTNALISVQDINLLGDFQNVSQDYQTTNLYGIRECCQTNSNTSNTNMLLASNQEATFKPLTKEQISNLFQPYAQFQALNLLNKLSNDSTQIFGHPITYFVTDPDGNGIDYSLHEFQLYNVVCSADVKVTVDNNQFPDNQIKINQYDLSLFESFEIQITKEIFKNTFGIERRPSKEDRVYFCELNRMFIVDHAQQFRSFNNSAIYYKIMLKKYNEAANVKPGSKIIENSLRELTKNATIDELFGVENKLDKASVANLAQTETLSRDPIRLEYSAQIVKGLIENSSLVISKSHYDFSNLLTVGYMAVTQSVPGVIYKHVSSILKVSDNIGFYLWFNINNYTINDTYNFFNFYDTVNSLGWNVNLIADNIYFQLNTDTYTFSFVGTTASDYGISEGVWYCYELNVDQRNGQIEQWIYKRNCDNEEDAQYSNSTALQQVYYNSQTLTPSFFEFDNSGSPTWSCNPTWSCGPGLTVSYPQYPQKIDAQILASDIKITNIRLFTDIIPVGEHNKILNQYVIQLDSKYLVFADNATAVIKTQFFPYNSSKDNNPV